MLHGHKLISRACLHELQVDGLLEAFCEDAKITIDEVIQGIGRLNKISDLHEIFNVSVTVLIRLLLDS